MKQSKLLWFLIIISLIGTIIIFPYLPKQIPTHWGINGEIDDYSSKYIAFFLGSLPALSYLLMYFIPKLDPKKENYKKHEKAYSIIAISFSIALIFIHWIILLASINIITNVGFFVKLIIGLLFIIMGNYMTQLRFNFFVGIRLPWTLSNENVWKKTHRIAGIGYTLIGILLIITSFIKSSISFMSFFVSLILLAIVTMIYSYIQYQKEIKSK
ncbi:SdpI family protein [Defluviitalea phaphyphila]|uniref:SdpI family protein n=1 Tax=Defluviitalea phaphyphila TaxID=1473580 RepID=UPI00072FD471|nr:SdpI family protein [Defluviitalea phaphyphila]